MLPRKLMKKLNPKNGINMSIINEEVMKDLLSLRK